MVLNRTRLLDELDARSRRAMFGKIKLGHAQLASSAASLSALSPLEVLTRGYSVTLTENGQAVKHPDQVETGQVIRTRLNHGNVWSQVTRKESEQ